ncbi:MAG TPA: hypothetical protein VFB67_04555 [Candidatus Polarisedimenticolaceae bacterium]|nr:hypothetical protein [Candidatus Polarisedimenticolaceae bacterium]
MRAKLAWTLFLLSPVAASSADPSVTVRHFTKTAGPQWSFTITAPRETASAKLWWIVGRPSPGLIEAKTADVQVASCPVLASLVDEAAKLRVPESPIYVTDLSPGHPVARWANKAWEQLAVCADAHPARLDP